MASIVSNRLLKSCTRCTSCQRQVLAAFISNVVAPTTSFRPRIQPVQRHPQRRGLSTASVLRSNDAQSQDDAATVSGAKAEPKSPQEDNLQDEQTAEAESPPWYLQVQQQQQREKPEANPFAYRQKLPPLPSDPPPILQPLLQHLSVDIGLDYLTVLDLRNLDPPPALGANLVMIFGSARSEKHLNVSGDRLCRWLRTNYKLSPYADGLLGRNELKLKLRRKARRMKMLNAVGAVDPSDPDDGTKTGWICVNVGSVPHNEDAPTEATEADHGFIGFGKKTDGVNVVIQMMTEEKRGDLDLEGLWQSILRRALKQQAAAAESEETSVNDSDPDTSSGDRNSRPTLPDGLGPSARLVSQHDASFPRQHVRGLHTSARRPDADNSVLRSESSDGILDVGIPHLSLPSTANMPSHKALPVLLDYLKSLGPELSLSALGNGQEDTGSTAFLQAFYGRLPPFLTIPDYKSILSLHTHALKLSHPGYNKMGYLDRFRQMNASGLPIPASVFQTAIFTVLLTPHERDSASRVSPRDWMRKELRFDDKDFSNVPDRTAHHALRRSMGMAFELLEKMEAHGHKAVTNPMLRALHAAISTPEFVEGTPLPQESFIVLQQYRFGQALDLLLPEEAPPEGLTTAMLRTYAAQGHWQNFWKTWRSRGKLGVPRTAEMYAILFRGIADSGHMGHARDALNEWVPEMRREAPAVEVKGEVAMGVAHCLNVASYSLESEDGRWASLWSECRLAFEKMKAEDNQGEVESAPSA